MYIPKKIYYYIYIYKRKTNEVHGQLSLDLVHPLRLIFEPANIPIPQKADGGIDWKKVTAVVIIGIDDTHD